MKRFWRLVTSPLLCVLVGVAFVALGLALAVSMNSRGAFFRDIDSSLLFPWLEVKLSAGFSWPLFWFLSFLAVVAVLVANLTCCTLDRVLFLVKWRARLRAFLPHVMHAAILLVVAGHLVSSASGYRLRGMGMYVGTRVEPSGAPFGIRLDHVELEFGKWGFPKRTSAHVVLTDGGRVLARGIISPNNPISHDGYVVYLKSAGTDGFGRRYAILDVNKDDGALLVLGGAVLFTLADLVYLVLLPPLKLKKNQVLPEGEE